MTLDPFTQVHNKLWSLAEANDGLTALVRVSNRIRLNDSWIGAYPHENTQAGTPYLVLEPKGGYVHFERTSDGSSLIKRWVWKLVTGEKTVDDQVFPVEWELFRALHEARTSLTTLSWGSQSFVKDFNLREFEETLDDKDSNRGVIGWVGLLACDVELWFSRASLPPT
jgi:hypothetical protein